MSLVICLLKYFYVPFFTDLKSVQNSSLSAPGIVTKVDAHFTYYLACIQKLIVGIGQRF